jgi:23S rRNA (pseudouridine1915-N3)-methyltransferase
MELWGRMIRLIAIGKIKERYILEGIQEYEKRLRPFCKLEIVELKDEGIKKDSEKILKYIDGNSYILDSRGKEFSSEEFAEFVKEKEGNLTLIIGGSDGFFDEVKKKAKLISLSKMTFLHEMCRLFLIEQIYRAFMIINKRVYNK